MNFQFLNLPGNEDITKADDAKEQDQYGGGWGGNGGYGGGWGGSGGGYGGGGGGWGGRGGGWGGGGGGGRGCQWGCCGYNRWGGCRCCYTAQEARAYMDTLAKP